MMKNAQSQYILVLTNVPDQTFATTLAHAIVENKLAACVNILPGIQSVYRWDGKTEHAAEVSMHIKTLSTRYSALEAYLHEHHPYDVPEIIAVPVVAGLPAYLHWLEEQTGKE